MTYRPDSGQYVPESACEDLDDKRRCGWLIGVDTKQPLEIVDPLDDKDPGIEVRRHPDVLRLEHPELMSIVDQFQVGVIKKLTPRLYETLSHFEATCVLVMQAAHAREQKRELDRLTKKGAST